LFIFNNPEFFDLLSIVIFIHIFKGAEKWQN